MATAIVSLAVIFSEPAEEEDAILNCGKEKRVVFVEKVCVLGMRVQVRGLTCEIS